MKYNFQQIVRQSCIKSSDLGDGPLPQTGLYAGECCRCECDPALFFSGVNRLGENELRQLGFSWDSRIDQAQKEGCPDIDVGR